jgi:hypothetical protein
LGRGRSNETRGGVPGEPGYVGAGAVLVFFGGPRGLSPRPALTIVASQPALHSATVLLPCLARAPAPLPARLPMLSAPPHCRRAHSLHAGRRAHSTPPRQRLPVRPMPAARRGACAGSCGVPTAASLALLPMSGASMAGGLDNDFSHGLLMGGRGERQGGPGGAVAPRVAGGHPARRSQRAGRRPRVECARGAARGARGSGVPHRRRRLGLRVVRLVCGRGARRGGLRADPSRRRAWLQARARGARRRPHRAGSAPRPRAVPARPAPCPRRFVATRELPPRAFSARLSLF